MSVSSWLVGFSTAVIGSFFFMERLRDRKLLGQKKLTEEEIMNYVYKGKLQALVHQKQDERETFAASEYRQVVSKYLITPLHDGAETIAKNPIWTDAKNYVDSLFSSKN